jgi:5-oxoprolinase (ATP-hydrolysing) subunit A
MNKIAINCDLGEGAGNDAFIIPLIDSANIACGYHAGDATTMWQTAELCMKHKVAIGAHPSFLDRENFGRTEMPWTPESIYELITQQLIILQEIVSSFDVKLKHVKPHGALYNMAAKDPKLAHTIAKAVKDFDDTLIIVGLSGSHSIIEAKATGVKTYSEAFADRTYQDDGTLTPRSHPQALITDTTKVLAQVVEITTDKTVTTLSGKKITIEADTICLHGDGKQVVEFAKMIRTVIE